MSEAKEGKLFGRKKLLDPHLGTNEGTKITSTIIFYTSHALTIYSNVQLENRFSVNDLFTATISISVVFQYQTNNLSFCSARLTDLNQSKSYFQLLGREQECRLLRPWQRKRFSKI